MTLSFSWLKLKSAIHTVPSLVAQPASRMKEGADPSRELSGEEPHAILAVHMRYSQV
jgi:hypothetical protein